MSVKDVVKEHAQLQGNVAEMIELSGTALDAVAGGWGKEREDEDEHKHEHEHEHEGHEHEDEDEHKKHDRD
jgi:hypothetical protein